MNQSAAQRTKLASAQLTAAVETGEGTPISKQPPIEVIVTADDGNERKVGGREEEEAFLQQPTEGENVDLAKSNREKRDTNHPVERSEDVDWI